MSLSIADLERAWYLQVLGYSVAQGAKLSNYDLAYLVYSNPGVIGGGAASAPIQSQYKATSDVTENYPRVLAGVLTGTNIVSGRMAVQGIYLTAGMIITSLIYVNGSSLAVGQTNLWAALWDPSGNKVAVSQDETTNIVPTTTEKVFTLTSPYTVLTSGMYYVSYVWVGSGAVPTLMGTLSNASVTGYLPIISGFSTLNQTTPAAAPASINPATIGALNNIPYVQVR